MNRIHKLIWSRTQHRLVVVGEGVRGNRGKKSSRRRLAAPLAALTLLATPAWAQLPTGGSVVAGSGTIATSGADMTVHQSSQKMIANWQSFSIGKHNSVTFVQPNASAVALNRVTGHNTSQILGNLNANGQVFLVNPNGIVIGNGAQVRTGGFVASTLDVSDENFLAGNYRFEGVGGEIRNLGSLEGKVVALIAPTVRNEGTITGDTALAAGTDVLLDFDGDGLLSVEVKASTLQTLVENEGLIQADGGVAILTARGASEAMKGVVNNSGRIEAQTLAGRNGRILLLADMTHGEVHAAGQLTAKFVETSAANVKLDSALKVDTQGGEWLIDPTDITIDAAEATSIQNGLATGSVTISTAGAGSDAGDIHVNADITWSANTLTLNADRDININAVLTASGAAEVAFNYGGTFGDTAVTPVAGSNLNVAGGRVDISSTGSLAINGHGYTIINSRNQLQNISDLAGRYALGSDIEASATAGWNSGAGFVPIGNDANRFTGTFDGLGHTISGLTINRSTTDYVGLFGYARNATLRNVGLVGGSVTGNNNVGGLVGYNHASNGTAYITNVYATGNVNGTTFVGGLVGYNLGATNGTVAITNAYATGNVNGTSLVGGLIGFNAANPGTVTITNAYATGNVTGTGSWIGGLIGNNEAWSGGTSSLTNVYAMGNVSGNSRVGGLIGGNLAQVGGSEITITNAYATGSVTGNSTIGALVGANSATNDGTVTVTNAYWNADHSSPGFGNDDGTLDNVEGKTLTELQSALPAGFDPAIWGNAGNQSTPYLKNGMRNLAYIATDPGTAHLYDIIHNITQLQAMRGNLAGYYALGNNIDASVTAGWNCSGTCAGFDPIGDNTTGNTNSRFTGIFDGLGHTISDLTIDRSTTDYVGLFGYALNATLRNVGMVGGSMTGRNYVGGLVGYNLADRGTASIANAYATGSVTGTESYVGGLVGQNYALHSAASIINAYATGNVAGIGYVGGLVGYNYADGIGTISTASIANAYATGNVTGNNRVGGLVGENRVAGNAVGSIDNAYATGNVAGTGNYVGGLVGYKYAYYYLGTASITNAYATGNVTGNNDVGGLVGYSYADRGTASIANAYATGSVTGNNRVGGLVGYNYADRVTANIANASIANAYAAGNVEGNNNVGGLVGFNYADRGTASVANAYATGNVEGNNSVGGLVGYNYANGTNGTASIENAYATGGMEGKNHVGGLVGYNYANGTNSAASIVYSYASGSVTGTGIGNNYVGGLVGYNWAQNNGAASIDNAYATGNVTGNNHIGGLVGYHYAANNGTTSVDNAYATGTVTGTGTGFYVGGLVGFNYADDGTTSIDNAYATGNVEGNERVGGLVGYNYASGTNSTVSILNAYATGNVEGNDYVGGLVGCSYVWDGTASIEYAYATGNVEGNNHVGGLVGYNWAHNNLAVRITNAYATGSVTGLGNVGGLVGFNYGGTVVASFWDTDTSGMTSSAGGTGLTTAEMQNPFTFIDAGWDFSDGGVWAKSSIGENDGYMMLRWQPGSYYDGYLRVAGNVTRDYGDINPDLVSVVTTAGTVGTVSWGSAVTASTNVGTYQWNDANVLSLPAGNIYQDVGTGSLSITPAALTVTANDASKTYDGIAYSGGNGVNYSGFVNGEDKSVLSGALAYGGSAQGATSAGSYAIAVAGFSATNYVLSYVDGQLSITGAAVTSERDHDMPNSPVYTDMNVAQLSAAPALVQTESVPDNISCLANGQIMSGAACGNE